MSCEDHAVLVLDDDHSVLCGLERLLTAHGYQVRMHSDPDDFFEAGLPTVPACLLLDNHLGNGVTGLQVHEKIQKNGWDLPTVFLTAHWNVQSVVNAMRAGADGFLTKPFDPKDLIDAVSQALERARAKHLEATLAAEVRGKAASLTDREREIVRMVVGGMLNKEIASQLKIALVTVKVHRGRAMRKLGAGNSAELARIATQSGIVS